MQSYCDIIEFCFRDDVVWSEEQLEAARMKVEEVAAFKADDPTKGLCDKFPDISVKFDDFDLILP